MYPSRENHELHLAVFTRPKLTGIGVTRFVLTNQRIQENALNSHIRSKSISQPIQRKWKEGSKLVFGKRRN